MRLLYYCSCAGILLTFGLNCELLADESDCAKIKDPTARLACYDEQNRPIEIESGSKPTPASETARATSIWEQRILNDAYRDTFTLTARRPNYFMDTYASNPNRAPYEFTGEAEGIENQEIKFQISLQTKIYDNLIGKNGDLWFSYTQVAYWQLFSSSISSPFRETDYQPEVYLSFLTNSRFAGLTMRNINVGMVHQSNGRSEPLSRGWNRLYVEMIFLRGNFALSVKPWYQIKYDPATEDNPDIEDYLGKYEIWGYYHWKDQIFSGMLRNVFNDDRHNLELDWSFPIYKHLRGLVQYYNGYGESLIDYNYYSQRIGVGVLLTDWL